MESFAVLILIFAACAAESTRPNYITPEEFSSIRGRTIPVDNSSALRLPQNEELPSARPGFGPRLWTNAEVPYTLDPTFDDNQRQQVALALQAYHESTCIRFIPKQNHHGSWVNIEHDPNTCGVAHLCMNTGGQFAKFGGSCVSAGVMVHELGHTLCMGHEQTRRDRDDWISWNTQVCEPHGRDGEDFGRGLHKLYDYVSIEHYEGECYNGCILPKMPGVSKCGSGGPLSVLDIEILNEMYGCTGGCFGYRFVNSRNNLGSAVPTGKESNGDDLYTCRAYHQGDIVPGKYHMGRRECYVAHNGGEHRKTGDYIEVLTNPNGTPFYWLAGASSLPDNAVRGGRTNEREPLYIVQCELDINGQKVWTPGKYQRSTGAYSSYGGSEVKCNNGVNYLVCG